MWMWTVPNPMTSRKQYPEKLEELKKLWLEEAEKNQALPLDDRTTLQLINLERPVEEAARESYLYYPHTSAVPEAVAVNIRGKSFKILANVDITECQRIGRNLCPWFTVWRT